LIEFHIQNFDTTTYNATVNFTIDGTTVNCGNLQNATYTSDTGVYSYTFAAGANMSCSANVVTLNLTGIEPATGSNVLTLAVSATPPPSGTGPGGGGAVGGSYPLFKQISLLQLTKNSTGRFIAEAKVYNTNNQLAEVDLAKVFIYEQSQSEHQYTMQKLAIGHYLLDTQLDLYPQTYRMDIVFFHNNPYDTISYSDFINIQEGAPLTVDLLQASLSGILERLNLSGFNLSSLFYNLTHTNTTNHSVPVSETAEPRVDKNKLLIALFGVFILSTVAVAWLDKRLKRVK
jgi:hypothetical protein